MTIIQEILYYHSKVSKFAGRSGSLYIPRKNWAQIEQDILAFLPPDVERIFSENRPEKRRDQIIMERFRAKFINPV